MARGVRSRGGVLLEFAGRGLDAGDRHDGSTCDDDHDGRICDDEHDGDNDDHNGCAWDDQHNRNDDRRADDHAPRSRNTHPVPAGRRE